MGSIVWFIYQNRIYEGTILEETEHGIEGWYSEYSVKTKYKTLTIPDYKLYKSKEKLIDDITCRL